MAILKGEITVIASEEDVVYSEDPDVTPEAHRRGCGWIPVADAACAPGADVVRIRALSPGERSKFRGIYQAERRGAANHWACLRAVVKVGKRKGEKVAEWVNALAQQDATALDLLADRINQLSMGQPMESLYREARSFLGVAELEGVDDDAASKSAGG